MCWQIEKLEKSLIYFLRNTWNHGKAIEKFSRVPNYLKPRQTSTGRLYADWCGPCQMQLPVVDALSDKHSDQLEVVKVDVDQHQAIAQSYGVRSIPTLLLIQNNKVIDKMVGYQSQQVLEGKLLQLAVA